jgi:outer membrane beta-barrel protein
MLPMFKPILFSLILLCLSFLTPAMASTNTYNFSWLDPDKEVFVLQNRKFRKAGRLHLNLGFGITTSGAFVDSTTLQARGGFFFKEEWGAEFIFANNSGEENDTAALLRGKDRLGGAGSVPFRRIINNYMGGMILWSPFYSKINTFNTIIYLDWILGLGFAKVEETNNRDEFLTGAVNSTPTVESHTGPMWNIGTKFFINDRFNLRLDLTTVHYKATSATGGETEGSWNANYDLAFAFGVNF